MKLKILEKKINKKIEILDENFTFIMDSRFAKENTVFLAINNGNNYVKEALSKGSFVIYDKNYIEDENCFYVEDTIKFMQDFAKEYRKEKNFLTIAITGSNGKTTVKDILYSCFVLNNKKVHKTKGNYNNHIGLPFTILTANDDDEILILEMGMSNLGEIDLLSNIAKPDYSIITNVGHSHLENLKTRKNIFKAKTEIVKHTKFLVFVSNEDEYLSIRENYDKEDINKINFTKVKEFDTNLLGKFNNLNISLVDDLLRHLNYKNMSYKNLKITEARFQLIEGNIDFINDAYNASPLSMKAAIETFSNIYNNYFKIMILGDMLELGEDEIEYHENLYEIIENSNFNLLFLIGNRMRFLYRKLRNIENLKLKNNKKIQYSFFWYNDKNEIIKDIKRIETNQKKMILLKASRGMKLEEIMEGIK